MKRIIVLGNGVEFAITVALLNRLLERSNVELLAIDCVAQQPVYPVTLCGPEILTVCQILGIDLNELLYDCKGRYFLGYLYEADGNRFTLPFSPAGLVSGGYEFDTAVTDIVRQTPEYSLDDFNLAAQMMLQGKFAIAGRKQAHFSAFMQSGVQLNSCLYSAWLHNINQQRGVRYSSCKALRVERDASGDISHVYTGNGTSFCADIFIDCSNLLDLPQRGTARKLHLFGPCQSNVNGMPLSRRIRAPWGWCQVDACGGKSYWQTTINNTKAGRSQVLKWAGDALKIDQASVKSREISDNATRQVWQSNCLMLGQASATIDPLFCPPLLIQQYLLIRWLDWLPADAHSPATRQEYNAHSEHYLNEWQSFVTAHSQTLAEEHEVARLFRSTGRFPQFETDAVTPHMWRALLTGLGIQPEITPVTLASLPTHQMRVTLGKLRKQINALVHSMPQYRADAEHSVTQVSEPV